MKPCPDCGQSMWTYHKPALYEIDRPFTGKEHFVEHQVKGEYCPGSHQPVIPKATQEQLL
jgi:hypothetical protein